MFGVRRWLSVCVSPLLAVYESDKDLEIIKDEIKENIDRHTVKRNIYLCVCLSLCLYAHHYVNVSQTRYKVTLCQGFCPHYPVMSVVKQTIAPAHPIKLSNSTPPMTHEQALH